MSLSYRLRNITDKLQTITIVRPNLTYTRSAFPLNYILLNEDEYLAINPPLVPGVWEVTTTGDPSIPPEGTSPDGIPVTNAINVGSGGRVFKQKTGSILEFRRLLAGTNVTITQIGDDILQISAPAAAVTLSNNPPAAINSSASPGVSTEVSRADHTHPGVASLAKFGDSPLLGNVTLSSGTGINLNQVGQNIQIEWTGGMELTATATLTPAQVLALHTTPVTLIPAQGAGTYIDIESIEAFLDFNTTPYTGGANLYIDYDTTTNENLEVHVSVVTASADSRRFAQPTTVLPDEAELAVNESVVVYSADPFLAGDSDLKLKIRYKVLTLLT